jgi:hypothetical protein
MNIEAVYRTKDETYKLIETFVTDNKIDAWWQDDDEGYLSLGIATKLEEDE